MWNRFPLTKNVALVAVLIGESHRIVKPSGYSLTQTDKYFPICVPGRVSSPADWINSCPFTTSAEINSIKLKMNCTFMTLDLGIWQQFGRWWKVRWEGMEDVRRRWLDKRWLPTRVKKKKKSWGRKWMRGETMEEVWRAKCWQSPVDSFHLYCSTRSRIHASITTVGLYLIIANDEWLVHISRQFLNSFWTDVQYTRCIAHHLHCSGSKLQADQLRACMSTESVESIKNGLHWSMRKHSWKRWSECWIEQSHFTSRLSYCTDFVQAVYWLSHHRL